MQVPAADVARLIRALASTNAIDRRNAALDLASLGPAAQPASAALVKALTDNDEQVCVAAVRALGAFGAPSVSAVPAILHMMTTRADQCAVMGINEVEHIGPTALPTLVAALGTPDTESATLLLERLGEPAAVALGRVLTEGGARADAAAEALDRLGPRAAPAVPALIEARRAGKVDAMRFLDVIRAIGEAARVASSDVVALVISLDQTAPSYGDAIQAIRVLHAESAVVAALAADIRNPDPERRRRAAVTIGRLGEGARDGVSMLLTAVEDDQLSVRSAAVEALGRIGPSAARALPAIARARDRGAVDRTLADNAFDAITGWMARE